MSNSYSVFRNPKIRSAITMFAGGVIGIAGFRHALHNGLSLTEPASVPWYEVWVPLVFGLALLLYGHYTYTFGVNHEG